MTLGSFSEVQRGFVPKKEHNLKLEVLRAKNLMTQFGVMVESLVSINLSRYIVVIFLL